MGPKIKNPRSKNLIKRTEMKKEQLNRRRTGRIAKKKVPDNVFSFIPSVKTNSNNDGESTDDTNIEEEEEEKEEKRKRR